ncbi:MAG: ATP-binding protein [Bdellovibrio sp.]
MKVKLTAILTIVAAIFIGAVLWRTDSFVYGDRLSWVEAQTRTQLGAINYSLISEMKSLQRVVATFNAENFQKGKMNWGSLNPYYAAASFSVSKLSSETVLDPQILLTKESSKAANWSKEFVKSAVGSLGVRAPELRFFVKPFQDSQQGRYVALVFLEGNRAYALFGSGEIFQSLIDAQRGAISAFSIVTETGLTVGHSVPEYLGTVMRDDPIFQEAQQAGASHGGGIFKLKSGDLYGMYERIPQSNLLVLSTAPLKETMKGRSGLWWQFLLLGCGLVAVGIAAALGIIIPTEKHLETIENQLLEAKAKVKIAPSVNPERIVAQDPELIHKEKLEASMRVASALSHEMSGPLAAILGYSQMILAKSPEAEIMQNTDSIIRETRAARAVLDKLLTYAGEEVQEKNTMKVEGPLIKALKALEPLFAYKGVAVVKNIQETSMINLHVDAVIRALMNILQNSVEAMERMANKELKIDLFEDEIGIHLNIEDTGEGIEPENIERIFDPFYTSRSFQNHMGLGLSVAFGILKEHHAEVRVESQRGHGTKIMISFKNLRTVAVLKAPVETPREIEEMVFGKELPKDPPKDQLNELPTETPKDLSGQKQKQISEFTLDETSEEMSEDFSIEHPKVLLKNFSEENSMDISRNNFKDTQKEHSSMDTPNDLSKDSSEAISRELSKETSNDIAKGNTNELSKMVEKSISSQLQEAQAVVAEQQNTKQELVKPSSPLDVNIENLLELPEMGGTYTETIDVTEDKGTSTSMQMQTPTSTSTSTPTQSLNFNEDDLTFIDGFLQEEITPVTEERPTSEELISMSADVPVVKITPPKMPAKHKTSKLETYHVEIRRPGKRI